MMIDPIERQAAIEIIKSMYPGMPRVPWMRKDWQKRYEPYIRTENAIRKLPSVQPTQSNTPNALTALDCISRQAAIDALCRRCDLVAEDDEPCTEKCNDIKILEKLPSAEKPFKLPKIYVADGYDTVAGEDGNVGFGVYVPDENQIYVAGDVEDEIRTRALFHEICHWVQAMCGRPFDEDEANEFSNIVYDALPSVQQELEHTMEEFMYGQDMGNPEDGSL